MSDQFNLFAPTTYADSTNTTSLQASESGPTPFVAPVGKTIAKSGRSPAPASRSAQPGAAKPKRMKGIFGQSSFHSSRHDDLSSALANRLRAVTDLHGSTMYTLTWEVAITPSGLRLPRLAATARRIEESGCTSWLSPQASDMTGGGQAKRATDPERSNNLNDYALMAEPWATPASLDWKNGTASQETMERNARPLNEQAVAFVPWNTPHCPRKNDSQAQLASWSTPRAEDAESAGMRHSRGVADTLTAQSSLAAWSTPSKADAEGGGKITTTNRREDGTKITCALRNEARLTTWHTPRANDAEKRGAVANDPRNGLVGEARLTASGGTPNGSTAETKSTGQLNPALARWLMGLPDVFCDCAVTATESLRRRRKLG